MDINHLYNLVGVLKQLIFNGVPDRGLGLCANVKSLYCSTTGVGRVCYDAEVGPWLSDQFQAWPHFSGNPLYPVPPCGVPADYTPVEAFYHPSDMYKGEYGAMRIKLLHFLHERASAQFKQESAKVMHQRLLELHRRVRLGQERDVGICTNVGATGVDWTQEWLYGEFAAWPRFSGDSAYPVPAPEGWWGEGQNKEAYFDAKYNETMWDASTNYGADRLHLLDFLIERAEKEAKGDF